MADDNRVQPIMGVKPDGSIAPVEIDNATGRVLAVITDVSSVTPVVTPVRVRDANRIPTMYGADASGDPQSLLTDNRNGNLWAVVNVE